MADRTTEYLVDVGHRWPARLLIEQAAVLTALARRTDEAPLLASRGFPAARLDEVDALGRSVQARLGTQRQAREDVPAATHGLNGLVAEAKAWQRDLIATAKNAFEEEGPGSVDDFLPKGVIGRSVPRLAEYLAQVLPVVDRRSAELEGWGFDEARRTRGRELLEAIRNHDAAQETAKKHLPQETAELYAEKGRLYGLLKKLVRSGRAIHGGRGAMADAYNLDILSREYQPRPAKAAPTQPAAPAQPS